MLCSTLIVSLSFLLKLLQASKVALRSLSILYRKEEY